MTPEEYILEREIAIVKEKIKWGGLESVFAVIDDVVLLVLKEDERPLEWLWQAYNDDKFDQFGWTDTIEEAKEAAIRAYVKHKLENRK